MSIHSRIKERRLALGMTSHQALADKVGVSWQTVQLWEKEGGTAPNRNRIEKVAGALGVTPTWLMHGEGAGGGGGGDSSDTTLGGRGGGGDSKWSGTTYAVYYDKDRVTAAFSKPGADIQSPVEYIFATHEEIHLLTLFRTSDERERGELMDRLKALKKTVKLPSLVGGDKS